MRHTCGTNSCPGEGEEMIGNDPKESSEANLNQFITRCVDRAAFRDEVMKAWLPPSA
jgi:hypothetical protein